MPSEMLASVVSSSSSPSTTVLKATCPMGWNVSKLVGGGEDCGRGWANMDCAVSVRGWDSCGWDLEWISR